MITMPDMETKEERYRVLSLVSVMNNEGTRRLARGECLSAISCFAQGLKMFRDTMPTQSCNTGSKSKATSNHVKSMSLTQECFSLDDCMNLPLALDDNEDPYIPLQKFTAVTIPKLSKSSERQVRAIETLLPFALIFNQALAHQLQGERIQATDSKEGVGAVYLKKAMKSYLICWNKIREEEHHVASQSTLYILASLHNMGRVYEQMGLTRRADACFERLLSILLLLGYSRKKFATRLNQAFFPSVSHLVFHTSAGSAPAA